MSSTVDELVLRRPDDWHLHLRDGAVLEAVIAASARHFARALVMPNLVPPVVTAADAAAYRDRIRAAHRRQAPDSRFDPLMTLYLTESTDPDDVVAAATSGLIRAVKLYPAGATTNSASGVKDIGAVQAVLDAMAAHDIPLCVHGEVTDAEVDIFDREARFIESVLHPLRQRTPGLRVIMEHVTTADGVAYVRSEGRAAEPEVRSAPTDIRQTDRPVLGATLTPHHLLLNRNQLLVGGVRPHYYCLPILKRETHRLALVEAATSGDARFFLGTDSAPHRRGDKESACGCAGVFNAPNALACLASLFEETATLDRLECFVSLNGSAFYGLPPNEERVRLRRSVDAQPLPEAPVVEDDRIIPFDPARPIHWRVELPDPTGPAPS